MSRRLTLGLAGLAAVLGFAVFDQATRAPGWETVEVPPASPARRAEAVTGAAVPPAVPPLETLRETRDRPLFLASRRAPEAVAPPPRPQAAPEPFAYDLVGLALYGGRRLALVRPRGGGRLLRLTEGQRLGPWRVTGIAPDVLRVRAAGQVVELKLKDAKPAARAAPKADPKPAADDGVTEAADLASGARSRVPSVAPGPILTR